MKHSLSKFIILSCVAISIFIVAPKSISAGTWQSWDTYDATSYDKPLETNTWFADKSKLSSQWAKDRADEIVRLRNISNQYAANSIYKTNYIRGIVNREVNNRLKNEPTMSDSEFDKLTTLLNQADKEVEYAVKSKKLADSYLYNADTQLSYDTAQSRDEAGSYLGKASYEIDKLSANNAVIASKADNANTTAHTTYEKEQVNAEKAKAESEDEFSCNPIKGKMMNCFKLAVANLLAMILSFAAMLLKLCADILDAAMNYSIFRFGEQVNNLRQAISNSWLIFRDIGNILFIFVLLYAAFGMILNIQGGGSNAKKIVSGVVIAAILINFSMFITKGIIDLSNSVSVSAYNSMLASAKGQSGVNKTFSGAVMDATKLSTIYAADKDAALAKEGADANLAGTDQSLKGILSSEGLGKIAVITILGSIFILMAAFTFLSAAVLFAIRFVVLVILIILSPIPFLLMVTPWKSYATQWWNTLWGQILFAPVYLLIVAASFSLINAIGGNNAQTFYGAFIGKDYSTIVINFLIILAALNASLIIAKKIGSMGAGIVGTMINKGTGMVNSLTGTAKGLTLGTAGFVAGGMAGYAGRATIGKFGKFVNKKLDDSWFGNATAIGRGLKNLTGSAAKAKFGSTRSAIDVEKNKEEKVKKLSEFMDKKAKEYKEKREKESREADIGLTEARDSASAAEAKFKAAESATTRTAREDFERSQRAVKLAEDGLKSASTPAARLAAQASLDAAKRDMTTKQTAFQTALSSESADVRNAHAAWANTQKEVSYAQEKVKNTRTPEQIAETARREAEAQNNKAKGDKDTYIRERDVLERNLTTLRRRAAALAATGGFDPAVARDITTTEAALETKRVEILNADAAIAETNKKLRKSEQDLQTAKQTGLVSEYLDKKLKGYGWRNIRKDVKEKIQKKYRKDNTRIAQEKALRLEKKSQLDGSINSVPVSEMDDTLKARARRAIKDRNLTEFEAAISASSASSAAKDKMRTAFDEYLEVA